MPADLAMDPMQVTWSLVWISLFFFGHLCVMRDVLGPVGI